MSAKFRSFSLFLAVLMSMGLVFITNPTTPVQAISSTVVISQFQTGGAGASDEFVEIHNVSNHIVDINGYKLAFRTLGGSVDYDLVTWNTSTIIPAGGYYLIGATPGYDGTPTADKVFGDGGGGRISGSAGGLGLRDTNGTVVDSVGYGNAINIFVETLPTLAPADNQSKSRLDNGCLDTDNNLNDFELTSPSAPRNSASTAVFCSPPDEAPTVEGVVPDHNATEVALDANVSITFSEPVNTTATWFGITCTNSGSHTGSVSGGPIVFTLDPGSDFLNSETCTVTITAAQVTDQDVNDPPDAMIDDAVWSFLTIPADYAPTIVSTLPGDDDFDVAVYATITFTFSETINLMPGFAEITCTESGTHAFALDESGDPTIVIDPIGDFVHGESCTVTIDKTKVSDEDGSPTAMDADYSLTFTTDPCGGPYTSINQIQGPGLSSPLAGSPPVTVEGVVTAGFQGATGMGGFYIQSPAGLEDSDPLTSEGLFVYSNSLQVNVGDLVRLQGSVHEYQNLTEMASPSLVAVCSSGNTMPEPMTLDLPDMADPDFSLEPYEGMRVLIPETLTVQQNTFAGRLGQLTLGSGGRITQMHNLLRNGGSLYEHTRMIILDDARNQQNQNPIPYYSMDDFMRAGDTVAGLSGILDQGAINSLSSPFIYPYNHYRLQPTTTTTFVRSNPRSVTPPEVSGTLKVVGFNAMNYFTTQDRSETNENSYPYGNSNSTSPRGADNAAEFTRQQNKLLAALAALDADVFGLMEIESWDGADSGNGAPRALVEALNSYLDNQGSLAVYEIVQDPDRGYFDLETDTAADYIQVSMIYNKQTVIPLGNSISSEDILFDRSPFAQEFKEISSGQKFVVVANHFKSRSCDDGVSGLDADQGDGQGCWNARRVHQAEALLDFINADLIPLDPDVLVIGDLNCYGLEDPIKVLTDGGLVNQIADHVPEAQRYSYVYNGIAGYLDHALSTSSLDSQVTDVDFWHINADEPSVIDYNTEFKTVDLYQSHFYRSSDHDPVIIGLKLDAPVSYLPIIMTSL
jgi:predicted extracellular nuclease